MKDEPIDFLPLILLLGVIISISFNFIMPLYKSSRELVYQEVYDKTVSKANGVIEYTKSTQDAPYWSFQEAVLTIAGQGYFMPSPRVLKIGNKAFKIQEDDNAAAYSGPTTDFTPDTRGALSQVHSAMVTVGNAINSVSLTSGKAFKLRYSMRFSTGTVEGRSDDCYTLCVVAKDEYGNFVFLEVKGDGTLDTQGKLAALVKCDITTDEIMQLKGNPAYANVDYFILYRE